MEMLSWNVNGIRAALKKGFAEFARGCDADVICLQEVRALPEQVQLDLPGYEVVWNPAEKKGYSGTIVLTRIEHKNVNLGLGIPAHDLEGRVITVEFAGYYLVNVYTPNSQRGLTRLEYRTGKWDPAFLKYLKKLKKMKPVVCCGDLNVAHKEIDLANPRSNRRNAGFTDEERAGMDKLVAAGFIDTFREFTSEGGHYTWWSNFNNARDRNIGWRMDYFLISRDLRPRLQAAKILPEVMGSDHCPVTVSLG